MERIKKLFDKTKPSKDRGGEAESIALEFLKQQGMRLIARNYHCRNGEIDLIMEQSGTLVFVEVRYRKTSVFGSALESIDARKKSRIIHCASHYLSTQKVSKPTRFDVVALSPNTRRLDIDWVPDAFQI
ncbi:MAG: YraN family protein [Methylococcaceae bacterium]|nr:YraN family protein [Methylococcaceae bacterium]MCI0733572.1 YraN family protein [Methylococcaceae bacterium]